MTDQTIGGCEASGSRFAVTTHSRLRSPRLFVPMLFANLEIRQQLTVTPGCLRFASVIGGPREFWTVSLWRSRDEMLGFMAEGAHERLMWNISRWFESFWLMRWSPTFDEAGSWEGLCLAADPHETPPSDPAAYARAVATLGSIPELLAAIGENGAPSYASSPRVRKSREQVGWAVGAMFRVKADSTESLPGAWAAINAIRGQVEQDPGVLRFTYGTAGPTELLALAILDGEDAWRRLREGRAVSALLRRCPGAWVMRWTPEHEFGHWDRLRVRKARRPPAPRL